MIEKANGDGNAMIKVSVIVPVHNAVALVKTCIESLIHQTLHDIEIIFIDDRSTDASLAILQEYQKKDQRITILRNGSNLGGAASRNKGLEVAKGKYIQFVDSDDYIDLNALEAMYNLAEMNDVDMCYLGMQLHPEGNVDRLGLQQSIQGSYDGVYDGQELLKKFVEREEFFLYLCSVFYRRSFIKENGLYFRKLLIGEGGDFILRALCRVRRVSVCDGKYYHYRVHGNSVMHGANAKKELLVGQMTQYISVLQYFSKDEDSDALELFLNRHYKKIAGGIQNLSIADRKEIEDKLETGFSRHVFHSILDDGKIYGLEFDEETLSRIREKESVIIYGAGYASKEVLGLLQQYAVEIIGFAVTKHNSGQTNLFGHHVYEIQELIRYNDTAIVLVAANKKYNQEMERTLKLHGFQDYVFLDVEI